MAKFKISAGAEIDFITKEEVRQELDRAQANWMSEISRGIRWKRGSMWGTSDGAGLVTIGENGDSMLSPGEGFVWLVKRVAVYGYDPVAPSLQSLALYQGAASPAAVIVPKLATVQHDMNEVLMPKDSLVVAGTAAISTKVWVTVQVKEAPVSLLWRI